MDLEKYREALGDEFETLQTYVEDLVGQRDSARSESIKHRKGLKEDNAKLSASLARAYEKLGISTEDELDDMPDAKGQADALAQHQAKNSKMARDLEAANSKLESALATVRRLETDAALGKALNVDGLEWIDRDVVSSYVKGMVEVDDGELLMRYGGGLIPLADGIKQLAKDKPGLLKSSGAGGSGFNGVSNRKTTKAFGEMTVSEKSRLYRQDPKLYQALKAENEA